MPETKSPETSIVPQRSRARRRHRRLHGHRPAVRQKYCLDNREISRGNAGTPGGCHRGVRDARGVFGDVVFIYFSDIRPNLCFVCVWRIFFFLEFSRAVVGSWTSQATGLNGVPGLSPRPPTPQLACRSQTCYMKRLCQMGLLVFACIQNRVAPLVRSCDRRTPPRCPPSVFLPHRTGDVIRKRSMPDRH